MNPPWWGIVAIVLIGSLVVAYGWWSDRRRNRAAAAASRQPTREIPAMAAHEAPQYVLETDLAGLSAEPADGVRDEELFGRRDEAATLPAGAAEGAFLNRADRALAVFAEPDVLVLEGDLVADRDTNALLVAAKRRGRPLVIVAPYFSERVLATLRANVRGRLVRTLPIPLEDAAARRRAVALTGGRLVAASDLAADWLPAESWGTCDAWIADLDDSWILVADRDTPPGLA